MKRGQPDQGAAASAPHPNRTLHELVEQIIRDVEAERQAEGRGERPLSDEARDRLAEVFAEAQIAEASEGHDESEALRELETESAAESQPPLPGDPASVEGYPEEPGKPGLIQMTIPVGMLQCNCTIIGDPITREALVVDPGDEVGRILELIGRHQLNVKAIVSTHAHIDHVGGLAKLHEYCGAPLLMHRDDLPLYRAMEMQAAFLGVAPPPVAKVDHLLTDGDPLRWGLFEATVIHTPGHTPGSICLYMPNVGKNLTVPKPRLFSGDTLFAGSIGRTDLWGGSLDQIMDSLRGKIMELPDHTEVFPGHGPATLIGEERQSNPFLRG
jgi:hydroxyacylglutathione hydrolase